MCSGFTLQKESHYEGPLFTTWNFEPFQTKCGKGALMVNESSIIHFYTVVYLSVLEGGKGCILCQDEGLKCTS